MGNWSWLLLVPRRTWRHSGYVRIMLFQHILAQSHLRDMVLTTALPQFQVVSKLRAQQYAASIKAILFETSAKENWGVTELFQRICERVIEVRGDELFAISQPGIKISQRSSISGEYKRHCRQLLILTNDGMEAERICISSYNI